eukprot:IDg12537t1
MTAKYLVVRTHTPSSSSVAASKTKRSTSRSNLPAADRAALRVCDASRKRVRLQKMNDEERSRKRECDKVRKELKSRQDCKKKARNQTEPPLSPCSLIVTIRPTPFLLYIDLTLV